MRNYTARSTAAQHIQAARCRRLRVGTRQPHSENCNQNAQAGDGAAHADVSPVVVRVGVFAGECPPPSLEGQGEGQGRLRPGVCRRFQLGNMAVHAGCGRGQDTAASARALLGWRTSMTKLVPLGAMTGPNCGTTRGCTHYEGCGLFRHTPCKASREGPKQSQVNRKSSGSTQPLLAHRARPVSLLGEKRRWRRRR